MSSTSTAVLLLTLDLACIRNATAPNLNAGHALGHATQLIVATNGYRHPRPQDRCERGQHVLPAGEPELYR